MDATGVSASTAFPPGPKTRPGREALSISGLCLLSEDAFDGGTLTGSVADLASRSRIRSPCSLWRSGLALSLGEPRSEGIGANKRNLQGVHWAQVETPKNWLILIFNSFQLGLVQVDLFGGRLFQIPHSRV